MKDHIHCPDCECSPCRCLEEYREEDRRKADEAKDAEITRLRAELAEARQHAKVLAYAAHIALEKAPKCFESPQLAAALKWAKEQP